MVNYEVLEKCQLKTFLSASEPPGTLEDLVVNEKDTLVFAIQINDLIS